MVFRICVFLVSIFIAKCNAAAVDDIKQKWDQTSAFVQQAYNDEMKKIDEANAKIAELNNTLGNFEGSIQQAVNSGDATIAANAKKLQDSWDSAKMQSALQSLESSSRLTQANLDNLRSQMTLVSNGIGQSGVSAAAITDCPDELVELSEGEFFDLLACWDSTTGSINNELDFILAYGNDAITDVNNCLDFFSCDFSTIIDPINDGSLLQVQNNAVQAALVCSQNTLDGAITGFFGFAGGCLL